MGHQSRSVRSQKVLRVFILAILSFSGIQCQAQGKQAHIQDQYSSFGDSLYKYSFCTIGSSREIQVEAAGSQMLLKNGFPTLKLNTGRYKMQVTFGAVDMTMNGQSTLRRIILVEGQGDNQSCSTIWETTNRESNTQEKIFLADSHKPLSICSFHLDDTGDLAAPNIYIPSSWKASLHSQKIINIEMHIPQGDINVSITQL